MNTTTIIIFGGFAILLAAIALALNKISQHLKNIDLKQSSREEETEQILEKISKMQSSYYTDTMTGINKINDRISKDELGDVSDDDLFEDAREIVIQAGRASASLLQRRLRVGYSRAALLLDKLEKEGVISPADGSKPREVIEEE